LSGVYSEIRQKLIVDTSHELLSNDFMILVLIASFEDIFSYIAVFSVPIMFFAYFLDLL
jgi:hypothetical protein